MTDLALSTYFLVGKINRLFPSIWPPVVCLDSSVNVCCYSLVVGSDCAVLSLSVCLSVGLIKAVSDKRFYDMIL